MHVPYVGVLHFENECSLVSNLVFVEVNHSCPVCPLCHFRVWKDSRADDKGHLDEAASVCIFYGLMPMDFFPLLVPNLLDKFDIYFRDGIFFRMPLLKCLKRFCIPNSCSGFHHGFPEAFPTSIKTTMLIVVCSASLPRTNPPPHSVCSIRGESSHENKCSFPGWVNVLKDHFFLHGQTAETNSHFPPSHVFLFFPSNPLGAHVALICHSEKVPWSVKWPVDDLCCRAAVGTCYPQGHGTEKSKSASPPSVFI